MSDTVDILSPSEEQLKWFKKAASERSGRSNVHTCILEDQEFSRSLFGQMLLGSGFLVKACRNIKEGMLHYLADAPDIVFMDIELPDGSGHDLAQAIRGFDPNAYIIMLTASNSKTDVARAVANGAKGFIVKPYSKLKILDSINRYREINKR